MAIGCGCPCCASPCGGCNIPNKLFASFVGTNNLVVPLFFFVNEPTADGAACCDCWVGQAVFPAQGPTPVENACIIFGCLPQQNPTPPPINSCQLQLRICCYGADGTLNCGATAPGTCTCLTLNGFTPNPCNKIPDTNKCPVVDFIFILDCGAQPGATCGGKSWTIEISP